MSFMEIYLYPIPGGEQELHDPHGTSWDLPCDHLGTKGPRAEIQGGVFFDPRLVKASSVPSRGCRPKFHALVPECRIQEDVFLTDVHVAVYDQTDQF